MSANREFREDLLYRINVLSIELPPLRSHPEDIPTLVQSTLSKIADKRGVPKFTIDSAAIALLKTHSWPGNIRELENVLERATAWADSSHLKVSEFECLRCQRPAVVGQPETRIVSTDQPISSLVGLTLAEIESRAIRETISHCSGNKIEAAKLLGVSLKTIYNKLEKLSEVT